MGGGGGVFIVIKENFHTLMGGGGGGRRVEVYSRGRALIKNLQLEEAYSRASAYLRK